jgi:hypothetical protein
MGRKNFTEHLFQDVPVCMDQGVQVDFNDISDDFEE